MNANAILVFASELQIHRRQADEPFASLPWEELDLLSSAMMTDLIENALRVPATDMLLVRNPRRRIDEALLRFHNDVGFRDSESTTLGGMVQGAVAEAFAEGYERVIAILDNQPTFAPRMFKRMLEQLGYEHECVVVGPTIEGRCYLVAMKSDISDVFDSHESDPTAKPYELTRRLCALPCEMFVAHERYILDTGASLDRLRRELEIPGIPDEGFPHRTLDVFRKFAKRYKQKLPTR